MVDDSSNNPGQEDDHEFTVVFKGEALQKLKKLAALLGIHENRMGDVLIKGIHIIDLAKNGKVKIENPQECLEVDIKKL